MRTKNLKQGALLSLSVLALFTGTANAGAADDFIEGFAENPGYVTPLATFFGTMHNTGYFSTANPGKEVGFGGGLDITHAYLSEDDQLYDKTFDNGCSAVPDAERVSTPCRAVPNMQTKTVPTIFGPASTQKFTTYKYNAMDKSVTSISEPVSGGALLDYASYFWGAYLRFSTSFENTEVVLRALPLNFIKISGIELPGVYGIGVVHNISNYFNNRNFKMPLHIALGTSYTYWGLGFTPETGYTGSLEVDGSVSQFQMLLSKSFGPMEVMLEVGYEMSSMKSGGALVNDQGEPVTLGLSMDGRNGFRIGLNFVGHWGYEFLLGQSYGAQSATNIKVLNFRSKEK